MQSPVEPGPTDPDDATPPAAPVFLVGQDRAGRWLAVAAEGLRGGLFATRDAALTYAREQTDRRPGAVAFAPTPIALG